MFRIFCVALSVLGSSMGQTLPTVSVQTPVGTITGTVNEVPGLFSVRRYFGIPYAEPPIGDLRFRKPVARAAFTTTFDAREKGTVCYKESMMPVSAEAQSAYNQSEDCLTLSVVSPSDAGPSNMKPVMVWIHGGAFSEGSSNDYDPDLLSGVGDVIIVTLNYRLAVLGFLSTGDAALPGNLGLWDQQLAIQWVHNNIESFGGDTSLVTIFGESAGAASVIYQTFYPGNMGLFQRAIAQSGGIVNPWSFTEHDPSPNVQVIANDVGCNRDNNQEIVDCLRTISDTELVKHRDRPVFFNPVYDNDFVVDLPRRLISGTTTKTAALDMFHSVDLMLGINNADGLEVIPAQWMPLLGKTNFTHFTPTREEFEHAIAPYVVNMFYKMDDLMNFNEAARRAVVNEYTDFSDPDNVNERIKKLTKLSTDTEYGISAVKTLDQHSHSPDKSTYGYLFAVKPIYRLLPIPETFEGPDVMMHADDILFVFGSLIEYAPPGSDMYNVYLATMTMWTNFAKSGNPNTPGDVTQYLNIDWPQYGDTRNFLEIRTTPVPASAKSNFLSRVLEFWDVILPRTLGLCPEVDIMTEYVTVSTPVGNILGREEYVPMTEVCGYRVQKFMGIPYAEAPTGPLRFKKPVAKANFTDTFNATMEGATCYQLNAPLLTQIYPRSEDCLSLNVFVPDHGMNGQGHRKAVMIWIHSGVFAYGQSNSYNDIGVLSGYGDVIVVTINYRLNMLGFLTTGTTSLLGNLGLWDQQLAIKWVHDNIHAFGGDPNMITIFGQGAGAASVIHQCFYPGNMGLFQRAIAQSGTSDNIWASSDIGKALEYTRAVSQNLSCSLQRMSTFVECLRDKPIAELEAFMNNHADIPLPVRDNDFIQDTPANLVSGTSTVQSALNMFNSVDLLMGVNNYEGIIDIVLNNITLPISEQQFKDTYVPKFLKSALGKDAPLDVKLAAIHEYTDWMNPSSDISRAHKLAEMLTDTFFVVNTVRTADLHAHSPQNKATYMYEFGVKPTQRALGIPIQLEGADVASNGDEVSFVTGRGIQDVGYDEMGAQQYQTYTAIMNMWTNFAKSGNPNTPVNVSHWIQTTWPMYSSARHYLDIKPDMTSAKHGFRSKAHHFWSMVVDESMKVAEQVNTCETETSSASIVGYIYFMQILPLFISFLLIIRSY